MSKFFRGLSESESESSSSDDEPLQTHRQLAHRPKAALALSDSEDDQKRVVRPKKDQRFDELRELTKQLRNFRKNKDMSKVLAVYEDLCQAFQKTRTVLVRQGVAATPRFYLRCLCELVQFVNENWEERKDRKLLNKTHARSLATLRQKLRKYIRNFDAEVSEYMKQPDSEGHVTDEEERPIESKEPDELANEGESDNEAGKLKRADDGASSKDGTVTSDWEMSTSSGSELEDLTGKQMEDLRRFFLKSTAKDGDGARRRLERKKRREERLMEQRRDESEGKWQEVITGGVLENRLKMFEKDDEITPQSVNEKLAEIMSARRFRGAERFFCVELLNELLKIAQSHDIYPVLRAKILLSKISAYFDCNPRSMKCLLFTSWLDCVATLRDLIQLFTNNPDIICSVDVQDEEQNVTDPNAPWKLKGCPLSTFERLDEEFIMIMQETDSYGSEYVEKLKGEKIICEVLHFLIDYMTSKETSDEELCRAYMRKMTHLYYKFDPMAVLREDDDISMSVKSSYDEMNFMCEFIYTKDKTQQLRTRAVLCQVYHLALHDRWYQARDVMLMSHLQAHIDRSDIPTQILYNRAVCQLGLCFFRHGQIKEALGALSELMNSGRSKELLAQGVLARSQDHKTESDKLERQRRLPYHMHINLELTECVYLVSAMLTDIPYIASREILARRRPISRTFHYQLKLSERHYLIGPPENTREHIMAATRELAVGNWKACRDYLINPKMNSKVWNLFTNPGRVREMLTRQIKQESLRTYLFLYSSVYDSVSLARLASMFGLEPKTVQTIVSKMIIENDYPASFDEPTGCVLLRSVPSQRMHALALHMADKLNMVAESLEQLADPRTHHGRSYFG